MVQVNYSQEEVLSKVSDEDIYNRYIGVLPLKCISSPLRTDKSPSFKCVRYGNKILWVDYSLGWGNSVSFVMKKFGLSYQDSLNKIAYDILKNQSFKPIKVDKYQSESRFSQKGTKFEYIVKNWSKSELEYWNKCGISEDTLAFYGTSPIKRLYNHIDDLGTLDLTWESVYKNPIFMYSIGQYQKFYRPFAEKGNKFKSNVKGDIICGYNHIPYDVECIIITKSDKDRHLYKEHGIWSVNFISEGTKFTDKHYELLKAKTKKIIVSLDYDYVGIQKTAELKRRYNMKYFFWSNSRIENRLDSVDYYQVHGLDKYKQKLWENIKN